MTKRDELEIKHLDLFGRKAHHKLSDDKLLAKIEEETGESFTFNSEAQPQKEVVESDPIIKPKPIKNKESFERGMGKTKEYRVVFRGHERWFTGAVIKTALLSKQKKDLQFPDGTTYSSEAQLNKCSNC